MGQRLPDDTIIAGDACIACENILWSAGKTPKTVYARFSGMERCPGVDWDIDPLPPNNRVFTLTQNEIVPCSWGTTTTDGWVVAWLLNYGVLTQSYLTLGRAGLRKYFLSLSPAWSKCVGSFPNQLECGGLTLSAGGFGWVEWKQIAIDLAKDLNIELAPTLFYEVFQIGLREAVYKFTDKTRNINAKSRLEW